MVPIVLGKDVNAALFDMNDPGKWPESFILAHGVVKRAKERLGGEKVRVKIVPVYIAADDDEDEVDAKNENIGNEDGERGTHQRAFRTRFERVGVYECCRCRVIECRPCHRERRVGDLARKASHRRWIENECEEQEEE